MFRHFIVIFSLCCVVWCNERKILSIVDANVNCGPTTCILTDTHMCFTTSRFNRDINNSTSITTCGTCLSINGSIVHENCSTEPTTLTNYTDTISINLLNSTVDADRLRNGVTGLLISEMANRSPSANSSAQMATPTSAIPISQQPSIIVVQPAPQNIYVNPMPDRSYSYDTARPERNAPNLCMPPDCYPSLNKPFNRPNDLPPQLNEMYNLIDTMKANLNKLESTVQDAAAGVRTGYLDYDTKYPQTKNPFPVWTPIGYK